ncbi:MAG TPA: hypothetical protein VEJ68_05870 [Candidatus Bathyarchaeia archaeon]|nr:hypothetical protein [Candidatus Bathyarchaeia archaeon]
MSQDLIAKNDFLEGKLFLEDAEFVCVINKQGRIERSTYKNDIAISKDKKEMFTMGLQLQNSMQSDFDDEFGPVNYTITERENSRFISIPTSVGILLVQLSKTIDPFAFVNKMSGLLNRANDRPQSKVGVC